MSLNALSRESRPPGSTPLVTPERGESAAQGTSEGLRPADEVTTDAGGGRNKFVSLLERRPLARAALLLLWSALVLGGLAVAKKFMKELESEVPPCRGTPSYDAQTMFDKFFPAEPTNGVFLVKTASGAPLLQFANTSTCRIAVHPQWDADNRTVHVPLTCDDRTGTALGGGCLTKHDLEADLVRSVNEITVAVFKRLAPYAPPGIVKQVESVIDDELHKLIEPVPNISTCPVASVGNITNDFMKFIEDLSSTLTTHLQDYKVQMQSIDSIPGKTMTFSRTVPIIDFTLNISVTVPSGEFWELFQNRFFADSLSTAIVAALISNHDGQKINEMGDEAKGIGKALKEARAAVTPSPLATQVSSMGLMIDSVQTGIDATMNKSTLTVPVALLILAGMVRNLRLLVVTLVNLLACVASAVLIMYPIASRMTTSTTAPALMVALALAMSIDYSLFLLTRFNDEVDNGVRPADAVAIALNTSGRIVLVSGVTLLLCFLMMLCLPVVFISSMGVCATVTVAMAVAAALTLTPVMLLSCPSFFGGNKFWGLSTQGCCCCCCCRQRNSSSTSDVLTSVRTVDLSECKRTCWSRFGKQIQRFAWPVVVLLLAIAVPVGAFSIPHLSYSVGLIPMMPRGAPSTDTVLDLQDSFGVGTIFPNQVIAVPPEGATATEAARTSWLAESCAVLQAVANEVNTDPNLPPFTAAAFMGPMILAGRCSTDAGPSEFWSGVGSPYSAAKVMVQYELDPFSTEGQAWIIRLREAFARESATNVASWYLLGAGPLQMDVANKTFQHLPMMVALMMVVVFIVIGVAFRSIVAPLRAVFCLLWMLVVTFGCAIFVFQDGALSFLHWEQLGQRDTGAMSWMSPCMAFSMVVGLGLDYDIFYSERVVEEWDHGYDEKTAAVRALAATANTISAAGVIMVIAFGALLISETPALNEISFLLILGVLLDCFVTTKVIIPCAMSLLGRVNFWPRKQQLPAAVPGTPTDGLQTTAEDSNPHPDD